MMKRIVYALALVAVTAPAAAQSLYGTRGLGVAVDPIDPRARSLGNLGLGLMGLNTSMVNPAELAGIQRRGISATLQPFYGSEKLAGGSDDIAGTRFPLIHLMYPPRPRLVFGLGYGGYLDQTWSVIAESQQTIGSQTMTVRDQVSATGAIAQARLSVGYELSSTINLGAALGLHTGGLERAVERTFPDSGAVLRSFDTRSNWDYSAPFVVLGLRYDPSAAARISVAATWSGTLDANGREASQPDFSYDMPLRLVAGASALINPRLAANLSAQWTGWSESQNFAAPGAPGSARVNAKATLEAGGGIEWEQLRSGSRIFPLRLGLRYAQLPFFEGSDTQARELTGSVGLGFRLAGDDFGPLAVADIGLERGRRTGWEGSLSGGLQENFWRLSMSIALFGR